MQTEKCFAGSGAKGRDAGEVDGPRLSAASDGLSSRARLARLARAAQGAQQNQADTDGDRAVGQVEDRVVMGVVMHVDKINHHAQAQSVDKISHGAGQNQRQTPRGQPRLLAPQEQDHHDDRRDRSRRA